MEVTSDIFSCSARVELSSPAGITPALILVGVTFTTTAELGFLYYCNLVPTYDHIMYSYHAVTNAFDPFFVEPVNCALQDILLDDHDGSLDDGPKLDIAVVAFIMPMVFCADAVGATRGGSLPWVAGASSTLARCSMICPAADNNFNDVGLPWEKLLGHAAVDVFIIGGC